MNEFHLARNYVLALSMFVLLFCIPAIWSLSRRTPALRTWSSWLPVIIPTVCFSPMLLIFNDAYLNGMFIAGISVQAFVFRRSMKSQPEMWTIEGITDDQANLILEKVLARSGLNPDRALTGLKFEEGFSLKITSGRWRGRDYCYLFWDPFGAWKGIPAFRSNLEDALSHVSLPPRGNAIRYHIAASIIALVVASAAYWLL